MKLTLGSLRKLIKEALSSEYPASDPFKFMRDPQPVRKVKPLPKHMTSEYDKAKEILGVSQGATSLEELIRALENDDDPIDRNISDHRYAQIELAWLEDQRGKAA